MPFTEENEREEDPVARRILDRQTLIQKNLNIYEYLPKPIHFEVIKK